MYIHTDTTEKHALLAIFLHEIAKCCNVIFSKNPAQNSKNGSQLKISKYL